MIQDSFYTESELLELGFKAIGANVLVSRFARFYGTDKIEIGHNVRIDDFCILSGEIKLGNYIHISAYTALYGKYGIEMKDYSGLSPRCCVFSASDDFSGDHLIGPVVQDELTNVKSGKVLIGKYVQLGCNCVVMPGITINEGAVVGAMSFVSKSLDAWGIYKGIPARFHKARSRKLLEFGL
jgi:acetyltransferase-like isoleucine patch superfamily enzyme